MNATLKNDQFRYNYQFILLGKSYSLLIEGLERERISKIQENLSKELSSLLSHYNNLIDREAAYLLILLKFLSSEEPRALPICGIELNNAIEGMLSSLARLEI